MKNKLVLSIVLSLLICLTSWAQDSSSNSLNTGGFTQNKTGLSVSWTMGEVFSPTFQQDYHLTGGFQQGNLTPQKDPIANDSDEEDEQIEWRSVAPETDFVEVQNLSLFPNPTSDQLALRFAQIPQANCSLIIYDASGKKIFQQEIQVQNQQEITIPQVAQLFPGLYILHVSQNGKSIARQTFLKV